MKRFHAAGICDCCEAPCCVDCGEPLDFAWFDGRCSACGDAKYDREHPYSASGPGSDKEEK